MKVDAGDPRWTSASIERGLRYDREVGSGRESSPDATTRPEEDAVKSSTQHEPTSSAIDEPRSRRELLRSGSMAMAVGLLGVFGIATTGSAKNGSTLRAGDKATASRSTTIELSKGPALQARTTGKDGAVGVRGVANATKGIGVQGSAPSSKGATVGVQGSTQSPEGTAGEFVADGGGTALAASAAKEGVALRTKGRLMLTERSGIATVSQGGAEFVIPVLGGLSEKSLVLATLQDHRPGVHVEAAHVLDVDEGLIVVRLNQAVAEQTEVGWFVLD